MLFHSADFLKFFAAFALLYWLARGNLAARNVLILAGSYLFYGWWDYRFLGLIIVSTLLDYAVGLGLAATRSSTRRRLYLGLSLLGNLGILGFFKYYGFFVESLGALLEQVGLPLDLWSLRIVLPVGISFYTFQTMSYTLDIYRGDMKPTRDLVAFAAYVGFFPQLVAGPIERARHLLPQFERTRHITRPMVEEGVWLCLWGLFKKIVVADNLAPLVDMVYGDATAQGPVIALATLAFGLQIYGDFSGYSDMARGLARLLGFDIMVNFRVPYAATNPREFWHRWHISLSTWLRDYVYISCGGNRRGSWRTYRNLMVTMVLGGLWHGAAWHFVLWGFYHGLGLAAHRLWRRRRDAGGPAAPASSQTPRISAVDAGPVFLPAGSRGFPTPGSIWGQESPPNRPVRKPAPRSERSPSTPFNRQMVTQAAAWFAAMVFVFYGWLLFRAESWSHIVSLTAGAWVLSWPAWIGGYAVNLAVFSFPLILVDGWQLWAGDRLAALRGSRLRASMVQGCLLLGIILYWRQEGSPFLYFQF